MLVLVLVLATAQVLMLLYHQIRLRAQGADAKHQLQCKFGFYGVLTLLLVPDGVEGRALEVL